MKESGILLVDDDRRYLNMISTIFEAAGLRIHTSESPADAISKARETRFSLILTDYNMPVMNGIELAKVLKKIAPDSHIVMVTNSHLPHVLPLAIEAGISNVYRKPSKLKDVMDILVEEKRNIAPPLKDALLVNAHEERPAADNRRKGMSTWTCPECHTVFVGWSNLRECSKCGHRELYH